jgi:hypothetical protein
MSSPNISFDNIPSSIRKPGQYFEFNTTCGPHVAGECAEGADCRPDARQRQP